MKGSHIISKKENRYYFSVAALLFFSLNILLTPATSFARQKGYKIAYNVLESREQDNYDIYSMNMDGTGKKNITNTPGVEWVYYAWKDKLYFVSDRDTCHRCYFLYEMDAEGNNIRKISDLQLEDSWMGSRNNGKEMIVVGRKGKEWRNQLFLIDLVTGAQEQLTHDSIATMADPIFLPGGKKIVLRFRPDKKKRGTVPAELWTMELDRSGQQQLTYFPAKDTATKWFEYHAGPPQWNSRYGFISYLSRQKEQTQIFAVTPDGKKRWQLTPFDSLSSGWHSWSSNGRWLAMDKSTHEGKAFDIYLMDYQTKKVVRLTNDDKTEMAPVIAEVHKK